MYHKEQYLAHFHLICILLKTRVDKETELTQYADNTKILTFVTSRDESKFMLVQNVNKLIQYFHEHELTVKISKSEFMKFDKSKKKDLNEQIIINSIPIDEKLEVY